MDRPRKKETDSSSLGDFPTLSSRTPQPASDITLSEIDRVTRFTSLSLVHSITVHLGYRCIDFGPLRELELPPPLAIAVFVVSTPGPNSSTSSQHYDLSLLAQLVSPRVFIVRGRQPKPDSIHFRPAIISVVLGQYSATAPYWDLLEVALLIGASVHHWDLVDSRQSEVRLDSSLTLPPLRMIVDLVSAPEEQFAISGHAASFVRRDGVISDSARKGINLKAWVRSAGSKKTLEEEMKRWELQIPFIPLKGKHADVQVVCDRIRRFRDDLALGANKGMDWAVLDEM